MKKKSKGKSKKMLAYSKEVLRKVSFDVSLFKKELSKAFQYLLEEEIEDLRQWVINNFGSQYCLQPVLARN